MNDVIERVDLLALRLPFHAGVQFRSSQRASGLFTLLRLTTREGAEGIAEATALPTNASSDPRVIGAQLNNYRSILIGADPLDHHHIMAGFGRLRDAAPLKALVDVALWDLKGKLLGVPVWRLLGGGPLEPIPVTAIVFGDTPATMVAAAESAVRRGFRSLKIKIWRRSFEDIKLVAQIRKSIGDDVFLYVDANQAYTEVEARMVLPRLADYNVALIEDPCQIPAERLASLARFLPAAILGDIPIDSLTSARHYLGADAVGAVSVHVGRTGISETIKIAALCESAGVPTLIGTDLETSLGALVRLTLRQGVPSLGGLPAETQFFENIAGEVLGQPLAIVDGSVAVLDRPGFGATIDEAALRRYST